ncbi:hypothetical protein IJ596_01145 [bacterium]|nr:hypothetical protein [bacterium]
MSSEAINGISMDRSTGNRQLDIYKRIQKFKDDFASVAGSLAVGRPVQFKGSIFDSQSTAAGQL